MGFDNTEILIAARDKYGEDVNMASRLKDDENEEESNGKIASLHWKSVFHSGGSMEDDGFSADDIYVDFRDDEPRNIEDEPSKSIDEAKYHGL